MSFGIQDSNPLANQQLFMAACGQTTRVFNFAQIELYLTLCLEELGETVTAMKKIRASMAAGSPLHRADVIELVDGAGDMLVVAGGLLASTGVNTQAVMDEIWRTNLAKIMPNGKVRRREDGKVLKPDGWEPPQLAVFVDKVLGLA